MLARAVYQNQIADDLELLLKSLPFHLVETLSELGDRDSLLEIVLDLGRLPEARYYHREVSLSDREVSEADIEWIVRKLGDFSGDNRAGIERTLHRISAIRNRQGRIVGLTCRIGRAVYGTSGIIRDLVESGKSALLLGRPGVGKTTMLREVARVLADDLGKRVIVVDTSNEIAGDGDIPHSAIGRARRMQVPVPTMQHSIMIEAVENHMPEVIVIDEIGTELEATAARTIAERGVQLVGTAHGNTIENLMMNPTLADLVGGIQSVILGDDEARRRGTQKSVLERKAPPTFDVVVELQSWDRVAVHADVTRTVDAILRGREFQPQIRRMSAEGELLFDEATDAFDSTPAGVGDDLDEATFADPGSRSLISSSHVVRLSPFGISRAKVEQASQNLQIPVDIAQDISEAEAVLTLKSYFRKKSSPLREAEAAGIPIYVLKSNTVPQIAQALASMYDLGVRDPIEEVLEETEKAINQVLQNGQSHDLPPQNSYVRRAQHEMADRYNLKSRSYGKEPNRRVRLFGPNRN